MNKLFFFILLLAIFGGVVLLLNQQKEQKKTSLPRQTVTHKSSNMKITSSAFEHNQSIPKKYTCDGDNINPPLTFSDVPTDTKSLALIVDDPDAPMGTWDHWVVFNMSPDTKEIPENSKPAGVVGKNTSGENAYQGPCPPDRQHRYFFKLYALDIMLTLDSQTTKKDLEKAMEGHILSQSELIGLYDRPR